MDINELPHNRDITYFARTNFRGSNQLFGIKRKDRRQHMYVLGKSGTGKSAMLSNMIIQNIRNGEGVCVVDPHGELVEGVLSSIPKERLKDVIYFNPADTDYHIGFNVLELENEKYKHLVASGLMGIFTKIWANTWSARMEYILNNAILALLDTPGTTLLGIPRLLVDKDYRQTIINNLKDPVVKAFWVHEYEQWRDQFRNEAIAPIQNKVGQFLSTSIVRNVVGQSKSTINIFDIMNTGKIFLVNVSKGRIGEDNSALLGGMLITKIQLAAMERVRVPEDERKDFYLYVDEFQNFVTESFAGILSEARKYRLNLIIAHQYTGQLVTENGTAVRDAVFGNVGTMIVFRVGAPDADFLEKEFEPEITPEDLVGLPNYNVYLKLMVDGFTSRPFSASTIAPLKLMTEVATEEEIIDMSRALYTLPKEVIEKDINQWSGNMGSVREDFGPATGEGEGGKFKATCGICGKEIMVPFAPQPGRPVYCKEDLAKIKSGEVQPIRMPRARESKSYADLSGIGIEFKREEGSPKKFDNRQEFNRDNSKEKFKFERPKREPRKIEESSALKDALKSALDLALGKEVKKTSLPAKEINKTPPAEIKKVEPKQEVKPTISLKELAHPTVKKNPEPKASDFIPGTDIKFSKKEASPEHLSALRDAITKATGVAPKELGEKKEEQRKNPTQINIHTNQTQNVVIQNTTHVHPSIPSTEEVTFHKNIEEESLKKAEEETKKRLREEELHRKNLEAEVAKKEAEEKKRWAEEKERELKENPLDPPKPKEVPEDVLKKILES